MVPDALSGGPHFAAYSERYIRHTKGRWAGQPLVFEDWQREFWWEALEFDPATGLRIYNEVGLGLPRKNSKSTMASGAGLYMLDADGESEPEVYVAAAARNQAGIVMGQSISMVRRSPLLLDRLRPYRSLRIECARNGGIMRSLSSDGALQHGLNPSANIIDELHAHKNGELYTALTTGTGAREQPFTLWITTAGVAGEGILADLYDSMFSGTRLLNWQHRVIEALYGLPFVTIAAINGDACGGGGLGLAMACDMRISVRKARFWMVPMMLDVVQDFGLSWLMQRHIGVSRTLQMAVLGSPIPAEQGLAWGMLNEMVEDQPALDARLDALEKHLGGMGSDALRMLKLIIRNGINSGLREQLGVEAVANGLTFQSQEFKDKKAAYLNSFKKGKK